MLATLWTAALYPGILRDRLPATALREDEVNDRLLGRSRRLRHEIHIVFWTSLPGLHEYRAVGLWNDPAEGWMTFPPFLFRRGTFLLRALLSDSDSPHCGVLLCGLQDPLELPVDCLPGFGRVPLRSAGKLDRRVRRRVPPDPVKAIDEQANGLAVLAVVPQQGLPEPLVAGYLPPVPPHQALQARRLRIGPFCPQEPAYWLQAVRPDREVDFAVNGGRHVDQASSKPVALAVPLCQHGERLLLVAAVVVDRGVRERLQPLDQGRPHRGLAGRVVRPEGQV